MASSCVPTDDRSVALPTILGLVVADDERGSAERVVVVRGDAGDQGDF